MTWNGKVILQIQIKFLLHLLCATSYALSAASALHSTFALYAL